MKNVNQLHLSFSQTNFDVNLKLFLKKWKHNSLATNFMTYFNKEWIYSKNKYWYEGAIYRTPSTNNALEATNNAIKTVHTLRERPGVSHFLSKVLHILENWSQDRDESNGLKKIYNDIEITNDMWYSAYCFISDKPVIRHVKNSSYYLVAKQNIKLEDLDRYEDLMFCDDSCIECFENISFDDFISLNNIISRVELSTDWKRSSCSCFTFLKKYMCRHIIAIAVSLNIIVIDDKHKIISRKTLRGRKKKAKSALELQSD